MNLKLVFISLMLIVALIEVSCDKEETVMVKNPTQEEYKEIIEKLEYENEAEYFTNMLKSAGIQFDDSTKLTLFVIIDNPYIKDVLANDEDFLQNHIVKGTFRLKDFDENTELTAINGNKINVRRVDSEKNIFWVNQSLSCGLDETEIDGNVIHYIYSPILCNEEDYSNYLYKTKAIFPEFIEYTYVFDAVLTDISGAPDPSWTAIDNHTFNPDNEKIEKLWFDAFYLMARIINLGIYNNDENTDIFAENSLIQGVVASMLLNYFGGIPIYEDPSQMYYQNSSVPKEDLMYWTIEKADFASQIAHNNTIKNGASCLKARIHFLQGRMQDYTKSRLISNVIIESGSYALEEGDGFNMANNNPENIFTIINPKMSNFNLSTQKMILPIFRYSETCLNFCYSSSEEGMLIEANSVLQLYEEEKGHNISGFIYTPNEIREKLKEYWLSEFEFEGMRFMLLKKFGLAREILSIDDFMMVLPIPVKEIENNPKMFQNPGY